jgi:hypothetical protein
MGIASRGKRGWRQIVGEGEKYHVGRRVTRTAGWRVVNVFEARLEGMPFMDEDVFEFS